MDIEFDSDKEAINRARRGLSLAFGARVFDDPRHIVVGTIRPIDGENPYKAIRFISVRRSNHGEDRACHRD